jgi:chaperonin GroEL (HSP60 family)
VFPRTLAENAGHDALTVLSELYSAHERGDIHAGVNIEDPEIHTKTEVTTLELHDRYSLTPL